MSAQINWAESMDIITSGYNCGPVAQDLEAENFLPMQGEGEAGGM